MENKVLKLEFISMLIINLLATFYINYTKYITNNDYLSIILSILFIIPIYFIFYTIFNYKDNLAINDKIKALLGPKKGNLVNIFIVTIIYIILFYNYHMIIYYIKIYYLNKTPLPVIGIVFFIPLLFLLKNNLKGIARLSFILLFINSLVYIFLLFKLIPFIKINNIIPTINLAVSYKYTILNIVNIFLLLIIPKKDIINNKKINTYIFISLLITTLLISILILVTIGILGLKLFNYFDFPIYTLFKRIYIFKFINRLENYIFLTVINNAFINISISFYYINKVLSHNSSKLSNYFVTILLIIIPIFTFNENIYNYITITVSYTILLVTMLSISIIIVKKK